MSVDRRASMVS